MMLMSCIIFVRSSLRIYTESFTTEHLRISGLSITATGSSESDNMVFAKPRGSYVAEDGCLRCSNVVVVLLIPQGWFPFGGDKCRAVDCDQAID